MCGICGVWHPGRRAVDGALLRRMNACIAHRGPDDAGFHEAPGVGLGMRRLAIIDLAGGHQPMSTADGAQWIVFNGEIMNFLEVRAELEGLGHRFRTHSDTEVLLEGYRQWGMAAWPRFAGMYAAAIWDEPARRLVLARDPLGIKPLFFADLGPGGVVFGSELKCLFECPGAVGEPDPAALDEYLAYGHVHAPRTFYTRARKLLPGHALVLEEGRAPRAERFWDLRLGGAAARSEAAWEDELRERFLDTVRRHLISDVPLGAFLSGGVDSSAVVAAMRRVHPGGVRTFTIGFREQAFNEMPYARRVAEHLGTEHTEEMVDAGDATSVVADLARHYDEPFADSSAIPTWYVSRATRRHVTVALSGDGGDELFAGYPRYLNERWMERWARVPAPARALARALAAAAPRGLGAGLAAWRQRVLKRFEDAELGDAFLRSFSKNQLAGPALRRSVYRADYAGGLDFSGELARYVALHSLAPVSRDPVENLLYVDTVMRLPDDMLTKVDRASMAHSLEVRVPFLDHTLVDFVASMPVGMKLRGTTRKHLLRRIVRPWLPPGVLDRPKRGFAVPLSSWFRDGLGRLALRRLRESGVLEDGQLDAAGLEGVVAEHESGRADHASMLYSLLMLAEWKDGPDRVRRDRAAAGQES
ncbi:MAG: asparagine synthase (glutamine-hydrolyzing) [Candidatus Eisenbacteria bacterium]|nr:asparagine synthase (glutamine-hydrolyzing) [Candidatus Eisenbacteria bacterium]